MDVLYVKIAVNFLLQVARMYDLRGTTAVHPTAHGVELNKSFFYKIDRKNVCRMANKRCG